MKDSPYLPRALSTLPGVDLGVGQTWISEPLLEPAASGYLWEAVDLGALATVELVRMSSVPSDAQHGDVQIGSAGQVQVKVTALAAGEGSIRLQLVRPWLGATQTPEAVLEMPLRVQAIS